MIRTFTFVMLAILCTANWAIAYPRLSSANLAAVLPATLNDPLPSDTTLSSNANDSRVLSFDELTFQRRLQSLEKSVPLNYNEHVQGYIDIYLNRREQIGKMLGLSGYYFPIFEKALKEAGLPDEIKFITVIESALNPQAVSKSGAVGPWQFMYATAKGYGLVMDSFVDERKDPVKASYAAAHYFVDAYKRIGDWLLTIAAFNCGTGAVTRAIEKSGGVADFWKVRPFLPKETQNYVPAFIATVYAMNFHKDHAIERRPAGFNIFTDVVEVNRSVSISKIAEAANLDLKELMILNPSYKKQIINGSPQSPKSLVIPHVESSNYAALYQLLNESVNEKAPVYISSVKKVSYQAKPVTSEAKDESKVEPKVAPVRTTVSANAVPVQSGKGYMSYIVKVGDTLTGIAGKFSGMTVSRIKALNGLTQSVINPGMKLIISQL